MTEELIKLGESPLNLAEQEVSGEYTTLEGEDYFVIKNFDEMRPFFMTVVSASDHWLFISSNGGLSAGRKDPANALFPYYTDDKITDSAGITGARTLLRVKNGKGDRLWEPFSEHLRGIYSTTGNLYKNREGNKIVFEEVNHDLGLTFRYGWMFSEKFGIVKRSWLKNNSDTAVEVDVLDGIQNILPYGVDSELQNVRSTLVDAYKRCELDPETGLAMYALSSMIVDKAEPAEALKATTVWAGGIESETTLLSSLQLRSFREGRTLTTETDVKAERGSFFLRATCKLKARTGQSWAITGEVNQSHTSISHLRKQLGDREGLYRELLADIDQNKADLRKKIGLTDGIQLSNDRLTTGRHFSNTLFNIMRGGTFDDQYTIETSDFIEHIKGMNRPAFKQMKRMLEELPARISYHDLRYYLFASRHTEAIRYYLEYLPLSFSRRHGDPSRPWNHFTIVTRNDQSDNLRHFEGNWRDIFQNWEALAFSYPEFALAMVTKFVNASTIDGYNPYRITSEGIDWEVIEPDDPWSYIGYWGDHQIIYLAKLLEISQAYHPDRLKSMLTKGVFTYANVPYRIKGYDAIASNPKDTIDYDHAQAAEIAKRVEKVGSDGKLVWNREGELEQVSLSEKLLVMILTKLYNFIPEAGIWLTTQRPEWNDANNALVGNGTSLVTLYYLRRLLSFTHELYAELEAETLEINKPVMDLLEALRRGFTLFYDNRKQRFTDAERREFMDGFGVAGEHYRTTAYAGFTGDKRKLSVKDMLAFFDQARKALEHTIDRSRRDDGMYHSYNIVSLSDGKASVRYLYEMLEGQVAVLSAKYLDTKVSIEVLEALKKSDMYREDQASYMLYPDRELLPFLHKNTIDPVWLNGSGLVEGLMLHGDRSIVERDVDGHLHFNGDFHHVKDLEQALDKIDSPELDHLVKKGRKKLVEAFEKVFDHQSFTGRSGSFYGYEGLGSIYWHMVSKLLLAIQENLYWSREAGASEEAIQELAKHYYEVRAGIGVQKSPALYGAFPTDAYSHTPKYAGAQQPGMTGQVKEDIINRWAELGITVRNGELSFRPFFLQEEELLPEAATLSYYDHTGAVHRVNVPKGAIAFTYCQIPVIYKLGKRAEMKVHFADGTTNSSKQPTLNANDSKEVFKRSGKISLLEVTLTSVLETSA